MADTLSFLIRNSRASSPLAAYHALAPTQSSSVLPSGYEPLTLANVVPTRTPSVVLTLALVTLMCSSLPLAKTRAGEWYLLTPLPRPQPLLSVETLPTRPAEDKSACATPIAYGPKPAAEMSAPVGSPLPRAGPEAFGPGPGVDGLVPAGAVPDAPGGTPTLDEAPGATPRLDEAPG